MAMNYYSYKLKRELNRINQQLKALIEYLYEPVLRWHYDNNRAKRLVIHDGNIHLNSNKIALFLIYQPHGVAKSIFHTCNHFISQGYLPLVVCNSAVTSNDLYELKQSSWKILIRPNFGYDFGGYRDGIWLLSILKINPDFLIIINDSIWFPIFNNDETISKMENEQADFVGALQVDQSRSVNTRRFKHPFMGSFF
jgi:lipopolysaccharide biosynthesis protein